MLHSSLVFGKQHFISVPNAPYLDPSPSMVKSWTTDLGHQIMHNGVGNGVANGATATVPAAMMQAAIAMKEIMQGDKETGSGFEELGINVDAAGTVDKRVSNREKHH